MAMDICKEIKQITELEQQVYKGLQCRGSFGGVCTCRHCPFYEFTELRLESGKRKLCVACGGVVIAPETKQLYDELLTACRKIRRAISSEVPMNIANACVEFVLPAIANADRASVEREI